MADKTYKMVVTLSNGSTVDAGTFVAPQGPQGPQGPSGALSDWQIATADTELEDGTYLMALMRGKGSAGVVTITGGQTKSFIYYEAGDDLVIEMQIEFLNKKYSRVIYTEIGNGSFSQIAFTDFQEYKYIKLV